MEQIQHYIDGEQTRFIQQLMGWLEIPSVSSMPEHKDDMLRSAQHLVEHLKGLKPGQLEIWSPPDGHPAVFASWRHAPGAPTLLVYGHHDVQPGDELELWKSPPFKPEVRDARLYGRGSTDDKGQVFMHCMAIEAFVRCNKRLPINIVMIVEGEEETGSENLISLFREHQEQLRSDLICVSDTDMWAPGLPSICIAMRGLACFELRVQTATGDLHSGSFGGAVANAAIEISHLLASLHEPGGRIAIEGFYDDVREPTDRELQDYRRLPFDHDEFYRLASESVPYGDPKISTLERLWTNPSLDINAITSGFQGEGAKTSVPHRASAKLSFRMVADQSATRIHELLSRHLVAHTRPGVRVELEFQHAGLPYRAPVDHPAFQKAKAALAKAFGTEAVFVGEGGSIPFVREITDITGAPCLLLGFGLVDGNAHGPNEWLSLQNLHLGTKALAYLYEQIGNPAQV